MSAISSAASASTSSAPLRLPESGGDETTAKVAAFIRELQNIMPPASIPFPHDTTEEFFPKLRTILASQTPPNEMYEELLSWAKVIDCANSVRSRDAAGFVQELRNRSVLWFRICSPTRKPSPPEHDVVVYHQGGGFLTIFR